MLSQAEIDALLGAVADGSLPTEDQPPSISADGRIVKTYDFRRPAKFSNEQLRTLQAIHENVGRIAAARLSSFLRGSIVIQLAGTDQLIFDDYVTQLSLPTELVVMNSTGLAGPFMVDMDLGFALAAVDRLLGGPGRIPSERNEPTPIEADLIARVVGHLPHALNEGWSHLQTLDVHGHGIGPDADPAAHRGACGSRGRHDLRGSLRRPDGPDDDLLSVRHPRAAAAQTGRHDVVRAATRRPPATPASARSSRTRFAPSRSPSPPPSGRSTSRSKLSRSCGPATSSGSTSTSTSLSSLRSPIRPRRGRSRVVSGIASLCAS